MRGLARYGGWLTGLVLSGRGNVASALARLPSSARGSDRTGRYLAQGSKIAYGCSTVNVESTKALDNGAMISARATAISAGVFGVAAATACTCS